MKSLPAVAGAWLLACSFAEQGQYGAPENGSLENFSTFVQPVLSRSCASLDCHGNEGRPLRLYAKDGLRRDAGLRGQAESTDELAANMRALDGLDPDAPRIEDHLILLKPLAVAAGGIHHVGGVLWLDQTDPGYRCLHAWLRAGVSDTEGQAVCGLAAP